MLRAALLSVVAVLATLANEATADAPPRTGALLLFSIAKSENKNQVQYAILTDPACAPVGAAPVSAYWRMLEQGPHATGPLLSREVPAYGLASQSVASRGASGGSVRVLLNALPGRPVTIATSRGSDGACRASATLPIAGTPARLSNVYVKLAWNGVDYLLLRGWSIEGSRLVTEKIRG